MSSLGHKFGIFPIRPLVLIDHNTPFTRSTKPLAWLRSPKRLPALSRSTMSASNRVPAAGDYDTSHSIAVRKFNRTLGLVPTAVENEDVQLQRCLKQLSQKEKSIDKYLYLSGLRNTNVHLFYRLVTKHITDIAPLIYTPTVGEACLQWSHNYVQPEGLYLSYADKGHVASILNNWPRHVEITVVTDGSRILGLGDLGVNGMGIPVGKLALYIGCAGIRPEVTLPLMLDLGTGNKALIDDPLYMGSRREKGSAQEEQEFMDEVMIALNEKWPGLVLHAPNCRKSARVFFAKAGLGSCFLIPLPTLFDAYYVGLEFCSLGRIS